MIDPRSLSSFLSARGAPPPLALARRLRASLGPQALFLVVFCVLATANSAGYRYGASDQAYYVPAVMQRLNPALYPRDSTLLNTQSHLTFADETVAAIARLTNLDLPILFVALQALTLALIAWVAFAVGGALYRESWTAVALLAALSLRHAIPRSGTNTLEGYFHPRQLAFALGALAVCAFLRRRYVPLLVSMAGAALLHPTTTLWFVIWLYVAAFAGEPRWRGALGGLALAALPIVWWAFAAGPLAGRLAVMDAEWLEVITAKQYLLPLHWPAYAWALNVGSIAVIVACWRARQAAGVLHARETALVVGGLSLVAVFAIALAFQSRGVALAIQLQPARMFWMLDFLAVVYLIWLLAEYGRTSATIRAAVVAAFVVVFSAARGFYIMQFQFPDRPLVRAGIRDDDWGRAMAYARSTDVKSGWLADPLHAAQYGTSVRLAGERDVFVEAMKDSALGMYDRRIALGIRDRLIDLGDFRALTPARARQLASAYNLDFLVTPASLELPVAFESGGLRVYRIR
jgi:hypothetical protein